MLIIDYASNALVDRLRHFKIIAEYHHHTSKKKEQILKSCTAFAIATSAT